MMSAADRFWDKVETIPEHACWEWTGAKNGAGYGNFSAGGKTVKAHRFSYELENGQIPDGLLACHKCDNPGCVNPNHIFLGTQTDNMADRTAKGRAPRGERNGSSKLTSTQVGEIRALYTAGGISQLKLAKRFAVALGTINYVVRGQKWKVV